MRSLQVYSILLVFLATFAAAWPWPRWLPERDSLIARQDSSSTDKAQPTSTQGSSAPSSTADSKSSVTDNKSSDNTDSDSKTATGSQTGSASGSGTITKGPTTDSTQASSANHTSYDASYPAGGVSLISPAVTSGSQYYKIGTNVTFVWNYTSLLGTPSAVNVMATCTTNSQLYTIAVNQTVANATNSVIWDTGDYQATAVSEPLLTETYTLIIFDAASSIDATAEPGYLAVYDQYTFGMYTPQPYKGIDDGYVCATCSGALSETERRALGLMVGMAALTLVSFTWFVNGLGVVW